MYAEIIRILSICHVQNESVWILISIYLEYAISSLMRNQMPWISQLNLAYTRAKNGLFFRMPPTKGNFVLSIWQSRAFNNIQSTSWLNICYMRDHMKGSSRIEPYTFISANYCSFFNLRERHLKWPKMISELIEELNHSSLLSGVITRTLCGSSILRLEKLRNYADFHFQVNFSLINDYCL